MTGSPPPEAGLFVAAQLLNGGGSAEPVVAEKEGGAALVALALGVSSPRCRQRGLMLLQGLADEATDASLVFRPEAYTSLAREPFSHGLLAVCHECITVELLDAPRAAHLVHRALAVAGAVLHAQVEANLTAAYERSKASEDDGTGSAAATDSGATEMGVVAADAAEIAAAAALIRDHHASLTGDDAEAIEEEAKLAAKTVRLARMIPQD